MSTGLTFGTISSLYGLQARIIVPTAIAQRRFSPDIAAGKEADMAKPKAPRAARAPKPIPVEEQA